jgi:lipoate-protein ligase A
VILDGPRAGTRNMALDHAVASCVGDGRGVLRLYGWARRTVSFGRNEPTGLYSVRAAEALGVDYVRRPTGGRAVLHDREVTYAVVAPVWALGGVRLAYRRINDALASALRSLGATVGVSAADGVMALDAGPCFQSPAGGEVVADGRKLVGSAQARVDGALLQHGSIILAGDQSLLGELQGGGAHEAPATLEGLVGSVRTEDVVAAVTEHMQAAFGGRWDEGGYTPAELQEADRLEAERYAQDTWTWRR